MRNGAESVFDDGGVEIGTRRLSRTNSNKSSPSPQCATVVREIMVKYVFVLHITDDKHVISYG